MKDISFIWPYNVLLRSYARIHHESKPPIRARRHVWHPWPLPTEEGDVADGSGMKKEVSHTKCDWHIVNQISRSWLVVWIQIGLNCNRWGHNSLICSQIFCLIKYVRTLIQFEEIWVFSNSPTAVSPLRPALTQRCSSVLHFFMIHFRSLPKYQMPCYIKKL